VAQSLADHGRLLVRRQAPSLRWSPTAAAQLQALCSQQPGDALRTLEDAGHVKRVAQEVLAWDIRSVSKRNRDERGARAADARAPSHRAEREGEGAPAPLPQHKLALDNVELTFELERTGGAHVLSVALRPGGGGGGGGGGRTRSSRARAGAAAGARGNDAAAVPQLPPSPALPPRLAAPPAATRRAVTFERFEQAAEGGSVGGTAPDLSGASPGAASGSAVVVPLQRAAEQCGARRPRPPELTIDAADDATAAAERPASSHPKVLLLGDGDFSFAASLLSPPPGASGSEEGGPSLELLATSFDDEATLVRKYGPELRQRLEVRATAAATASSSSSVASLSGAAACQSYWI
jgi:hypothetical protein